MRTAVITTTVLLSAAVLAGCKGGESGGQPTPSPTVTTSPSPTPVDPTPTPSATPSPTDPATPPGENEVSIRVEIPERTAPPAGG